MSSKPDYNRHPGNLIPEDKRKKEMAKMPLRYTPELGKEICRLIRQGYTVSDISEMEGMPGRTTIWRWSFDTESKPDFCKEFEDAYRIIVQLWMAERDELSEYKPPLLTPKEVIDKYDLGFMSEEDMYGNPKIDKNLILQYMRADQKKAADDIRRRIEALTRNIGQVAFMFDKRFARTSSKELREMMDTPSVVMIDYMSHNKKKEVKTVEDVFGDKE